MPMPPYEISSYRPTKHKSWGRWTDGSGRAEIYTDNGGMVTLFTFPGGLIGRVHHDPFTTLETYYQGKIYRAQFPRHYLERWWSRLAESFAWRVIHEEAE